MKNLNFRFVLSAAVLYSLTLVGVAKAAPVQFNQVTQVINAKPGKAANGGFEKLRLNGDEPVKTTAGGDDTKTDTKTDTPPVQQQQQDERVITVTTAEIVEDEACDCTPLPKAGGFPYGYLALGGIPFLFLIPHGKDKTQTPTPTTPTTPTETPTVTPPTPEPVPEPMTILLFGTGLAGIGVTARRRFGKKEKEETEA